MPTCSRTEPTARAASAGPEPIREDICEEAARLCHLVCESPCSSPATKALLALFLFHSARFAARTDRDGAVVLLEDQDRRQWDARLICAGQFWLSQSRCDQPSVFHLEAAIAMQHCIASDVAQTDWALIVQLYNQLLKFHDSPIYVLNRAIAVGQTGQTRAAVAELRKLQNREEMKDYLLVDCALARVHELEGERQKAVDCCLAALSKPAAPHEKALLKKKLRDLTDAAE